MIGIFQKVFILITLIISCSDEYQLGSDYKLMVVENKEYYFHSTITMNRMVIHTTNGVTADTTWKIIRDYTYKIYFHHDTLFNDTLYKFVWYKTINTDYRIGMIRESIDGKVFFRKNSFSSELLLYDFSLRENDMFNNLIVRKSEILFNSNIARKQLLLTQCCGRDTLYWIQGIGNTRDILTNSFHEMCYCMDDGKILISVNNDGQTEDIRLLFVMLNGSIIFKSQDYYGSTTDFEFKDESKFY